jgi:hypothetical protein
MPYFENIVPLPRICLPSISDPNTYAPKCAVVYFALVRLFWMFVRLCSGNDWIKGNAHMPYFQFRWTDRIWIFRHQPMKSQVRRRLDLREPTNVWFAISNDISASMLVFPKYFRFLTSKVWIRSRADPSAIFGSFNWLNRFCCSFSTYEPSEIDLKQPPGPFFFGGTCTRLWVFYARKSCYTETETMHWLTFFHTAQVQFCILHVYLPFQGHIAESFYCFFLSRQSYIAVEPRYRKPKRGVGYILWPQVWVTTSLLVHMFVCGTACIKLIDCSE